MNKQHIAAVSLGNVVEWFDFGIFIFLAPILGQKFFPLQNETYSSLAAFAVFAAGYICRPVGGILFGYLGDTGGRATTLRGSILLITLATFLVGILPTYQTIGMTATVLFVLMRIIQGISAGGEYCGAIIYLAESAPRFSRGFITSFAGSGGTLGFIFATLTAMFLKIFMPTILLNQWGWRLPFILIGLIGFCILYSRLKLTETHSYHFLKSQNHINRKPLWAALKLAPKSLLKIVGLTCTSSTFYIIFFGYMPNHLAHYSTLTLSNALFVQVVFLVLMLFLIPIGGFLGDRFGRKNMLIISASSIILFSWPCFYFLQAPTYFLIFLLLGIATLLSSLDQGNNLMAFVENCPADIRYSGIGFAYNVGNALFGGTAPLIINLLIKNVSGTAPAFYLMASGLVGLLTTFTLLNKHQTEIQGLCEITSKKCDTYR